MPRDPKTGFYDWTYGEPYEKDAPGFDTATDVDWLEETIRVLGPAGQFAYNPDTSNGLYFRMFPGRFISKDLTLISMPDTSVLLTAGATNYVQIDCVNKNLMTSTVGVESGNLPLYKVDTFATTIDWTTLEDLRFAYVSPTTETVNLSAPNALEATSPLINLNPFEDTTWSIPTFFERGVGVYVRFENMFGSQQARVKVYGTTDFSTRSAYEGLFDPNSGRDEDNSQGWVWRELDDPDNPVLRVEITNVGSQSLSNLTLKLRMEPF